MTDSHDFIFTFNSNQDCISLGVPDTGHVLLASQTFWPVLVAIQPPRPVSGTASTGFLLVSCSKHCSKTHRFRARGMW